MIPSVLPLAAATKSWQCFYASASYKVALSLSFLSWLIFFSHSWAKAICSISFFSAASKSRPSKPWRSLLPYRSLRRTR